MTKNLKDKRSIRLKGAVSSRISIRQVRGAVEEIEITRTKKSLIKCAMGGRISSTDTNWNHFVNIKKVIVHPVSPEEKVERNRGVFINIDKIKGFTAAEIKEELVQVSSDSYHIGC